MTDTPSTRIAVNRPFRERLVTFVQQLPQRLGDWEFWITQIAVLGITAVHVLAEVWAFQGGRAVPAAFHHIPVVLYLVPISYASLRYGMEGAVLTGLWSAVLIVPNLLIWHQEDFEWLEFLYAAVVIIVGIVMSVPVDRERQQRQRAEATMERQVLLGDIATLTLTADLSTTLDEALRRLRDVLALEATCVAVASPADTAGAGMTVLACHSRVTPAADELTACLRDRQPLGEPATSTLPGDGIVVVRVTAELPGSGPDDGVDGVLAAKMDPARPLTEDDHRLLTSVANHLAIAIANTRLAESERNRLRSYAMLVTQAQEEERKRIARELHDEALQNLVVIRRNLMALATGLDDPLATELAKLRDLAGQTVTGIRRFSRDLRPPTLDALGLSSALEQLVTEILERSTLTAKLRVVGTGRRLATETELAVFRIGQAALHNVEHHAAAGAIDVELAFEPGRVRLVVTDDGRGFEPPRKLEELPAEGKLGLLGMRERAQLVGGTLRITSRPDAGTRVHLDVPG